MITGTRQRLLNANRCPNLQQHHSHETALPFGQFAFCLEQTTLQFFKHSHRPLTGRSSSKLYVGVNTVGFWRGEEDKTYAPPLDEANRKDQGTYSDRQSYIAPLQDQFH